MKLILLFLSLVTALTTFSQLTVLKQDALTIRFSKGKWEILNKESVVRSLKKAQKLHGNFSVMLEGYTDSVGTEEYNTYLADFRLKAVTELMTELSIAVTEKKNHGEKPEGKLEENRVVRITLLKQIPAADLQPEAIAEPKADVPQVLKIEFHNNSAIMMSYSYDEVDKLYATLLEFPEYDIELHGHVCCMDHYQISYERAAAVKEALIRQGISADRITIFGHSNTQPLVVEITEEDQQRNRRVEAVFKKR